MIGTLLNEALHETVHTAGVPEAAAKAMLFGGVTKRFPDLPFVFLECGVSWGVQLLDARAQ